MSFADNTPHRKSNRRLVPDTRQAMRRGSHVVGLLGVAQGIGERPAPRYRCDGACHSKSGKLGNAEQEFLDHGKNHPSRRRRGRRGLGRVCVFHAFRRPYQTSTGSTVIARRPEGLGWSAVWWPAQCVTVGNQALQSAYLCAPTRLAALPPEQYTAAWSRPMSCIHCGI